MKRYQFYVGTEDKDKLVKIKSDKEFITCFDFWFENYTLQLAQGRYTMQELNGIEGLDETIKEKTFIVTVIDNYTDKRLKWIVSNLKQQLNQETILVTQEHLTTVEFM